MIFHQTQHMADYPGRMMYTFPGRVAGPDGDTWIHTHQLVFHDGDFAALGRDVGDLAVCGTVGAAPAAVLPAAAVADAAAAWLLGHRDLRGARFGRPYENARPAPAGPL